MNNERQEISEAIAAADNALSHLNAARDCLRSAGNWGIMDIMGGGFFSTLMKHSKMDGAAAELEGARAALQSFAKELQDVNEVLNVDIQTGDFLSFADYFFDGVIADWMMQKRINDAKAQIEEASRRVSVIRGKLLAMLG